MTWETMLHVLHAAGRAGATTLDITGGAPEMHPHFRAFVEAGRARGLAVIVRTNLTILLEDGYADMPAFFKRCGVHLIASLPCYLETNVDKHRGKHVYKESIEAILRLNALGYGNDAGLPLDLVYNPGGPSLPPEQEALELAYRRELAGQYGIHFTRLYTITNLPIGRFLHDLQLRGKAGDYAELLQRNFNPDTLEGLMCRHQLHVGYDGRLYDCDFNFAIGLGVTGPVRHIADFAAAEYEPADFLRRTVATGEHCFGCTAGCGSSCGGALV